VVRVGKGSYRRYFDWSGITAAYWAYLCVRPNEQHVPIRQPILLLVAPTLLAVGLILLFVALIVAGGHESGFSDAPLLLAFAVMPWHAGLSYLHGSNTVA
jgi:hypothetical protein